MKNIGNPIEPMSYIARKACGCIVAAAVDRPEWKKETAHEVARWIREGLTVERVTCDYVRANLKGCHCDGKQAEAAQIALPEA